ncbi:MAG: DUF255 domain-containing protein [Saprospiraceae bacterium]|nr:DUF255 domain-containing protein [Bacteroidia bacterium]NNE16142.1 DUF255 domain-containing protein [Saprospiraceae bacterium]NNL92239.1 DUF255 domain-containing protein [Saprospiraceae bacterium]
MRSFVLLILFTLLFGSDADAQKKVKWLTWEEALEKNQVEKKKIMVDVYTDWCGWCKKMEKSTFSTNVISEFINENFYPVKFNAEQKADIIFNNKVYKYVGGFGRRGYHELAKEILRGKMSYPTVVFIDSNLDVIQPIPGFQDAKTFEMIMNYFEGNHYQKTPWRQFTMNFKSEHFPSQTITPKDLQPRVQTVRNK